MRYAWRIVVNIVYLFIVAVILDRVRDRSAAILLPVLGILYVAIQAMALGMGHSFMDMGHAIDRIERRILALQPGYRPEDLATQIERDDAIGRASILMFIDVAALWAIGLLCLWKFLVAINVL